MAFQYGMLMQLSIMLLAVLVPAATSVVATTRASAGQGGEEDETDIALPGCKAKCGNVTIPYPFGIDEPHCCFGPPFQITCTESNIHLMKTRLIVTNISLEDGELQTMALLNRDCYDPQGNPEEYQISAGLRVYPPYTISGDKNRMFVVGCDTYAELVGSRSNKSYTTGCISKCDNYPDGYAYSVDKNDTCSGMGCCRTKIPPLLNNLTLTVGSYKNHTEVHHFNPCGYAFVVKMDHFTFSKTSFQDLSKTHRLPLVLDWQIGDESCEYAKQNNKTFACKGNSDCQDRPTGYICLCKPGFQGNPYVENSCRDIDECASNSNPCKNGKCINKPGSYTCSCDSGYRNLNEITCIKDHSSKAFKILLGTSLSFLVLLVGIFWAFRNMKEKRFQELKRKYFKTYGGSLLREKLASAARTFTEEEVKVATDNYHVRNKVGEGCYGIVYKGVLNKQEVAIKKSKRSPSITASVTANETFVQEMIVLSQINHKNVVRLVGCCFETRTPILVYEFIANGTLYDRIHRKKPPLLSLELRLQIASEAADVLAYLHHSISTPIIHGNVKTASILLDENFTAKVSDFGASIWVPEGENQLSILFQGNLGYLDPEYIQSNKLTEKSDVYSFGVVLVELLTSCKAVSLEKPEEERNLAYVFVSKVNEGRLDEILDREIVKGHLGIVNMAADLAIRCLKVRSEERPCMREIAEELQALVRTMEPHPSGGEANITPSLDTGNLVGSSASTRLGDDDGDGGGGLVVL